MPFRLHTNEYAPDPKQWQFRTPFSYLSHVPSNPTAIYTHIAHPTIHANPPTTTSTPIQAGTVCFALTSRPCPVISGGYT